MVVKRRTTSLSAAAARGRARPVKKRSAASQRSANIKSSGQRKRAKSVPRKKATKKLSTGNSAMRAHIAGYLDPFSVTGGSKIPDGGCVQSLPLRHRVVKELNSAVPIAPGGAVTPSAVFHIVMYAGLTSGLIWQPVSGLDDLTPDQIFKFKTDIYPKISAHVNGVDNIDRFDVETVGGVARWRTVSQALRLRLLNTDETNDGWFESTRMTYKAHLEDWALYSPAGNHDFVGSDINTNGGEAFMAPDLAFMTKAASQNLAESLSYKTGALKDIHRHQFNLMPFSKNNEFIELDERYNVPTDSHTPTPGVGTGTDLEIQLREGSNAAKAIYKGFNDTNHDLVYIRIHPGATGSKILAELCCNQEVVYDVDSVLAKHMSPADVDKPMFERAQKVKHDTNQSSSMVVEDS
jgi:hypothetical protein